MFTNYPDNPAFDDLADADLRDQIANLITEVNDLSAALTSTRAEVVYMRDTLNRVYAERDNARDDADALRNRYRAARKVAARLRRDYTYRGQFIETMLQQPAPVAAQPAATPCRTCGGTGSVEAYAHVMTDENGGEFATGGMIDIPCPDCGDSQKCDLCDGMGYYTKSVCGEWTELDCPACDGLGARRGTPLHQERQARRAAAIEAARLEDIPF